MTHLPINPTASHSPALNLTAYTALSNPPSSISLRSAPRPTAYAVRIGAVSAPASTFFHPTTCFDSSAQAYLSSSTTVPLTFTCYCPFPISHLLLRAQSGPVTLRSLEHRSSANDSAFTNRSSPIYSFRRFLGSYQPCHSRSLPLGRYTMITARRSLPPTLLCGCSNSVF